MRTFVSEERFEPTTPALSYHAINGLCAPLAPRRSFWNYSKVNVKVSMCLTKYHFMKMYPVLN